MRPLRQTVRRASGGSATRVVSTAARAATGRSSRTFRRYGDLRLERGAAPDTPNVLLLGFDDMNDYVGFLGGLPGARTPNIDALAARSVVFERAYCTVPMCGPARASALFGEHPWRTGVYDHTPGSRTAMKTLRRETPAIVDDFWAAGYATYGAGKVFHGPERRRWDDLYETEYYRSTPHKVGESDREAARFDMSWHSPYHNRPFSEVGSFPKGIIPFGPSGGTAHEDPDGRAASWVRERLRGRHDRPFFLAYGTIIPHVPWRVPQQFYDLHPIEDVTLPDVRDDEIDHLGPHARRLIDTHGSFRAIREADIWRQAVQAYLAAGSYADWCMGTVLDELANSPYAEDTIVVLWSDHGFHLGEKLHWHKFTLWERATRVPFVVHAPGQLADHLRIDAPVSLIDLGPTLADLCDVTIHNPDHQGASLLPTIDDPARADERPPISTWKKGNHAVRRGPWRYIRYNSGETELYDHRDDPDERINLAGHGTHTDIERELACHLPQTASQR